MYHLSIITPEKVMFDGQVYSIIAPGGGGYLEILKDHAPILTTIKPGRLTVVDQEKKRLVWAVSYGFLEMSHNEASLLVEAIEKVEEIDLARTEAALERARQRLEAAEADLDIARAKRALQRAENRIKVYKGFSLNKEFI